MWQIDGKGYNEVSTDSDLPARSEQEYFIWAKNRSLGNPSRSFKGSSPVLPWVHSIHGSHGPLK